MRNQRLKDSDIRQAFHSQVLNLWHRDSDSLVLDELALQNGVVRADIVLVNGSLSAFEIKSDRDSLVRLAGQMESYSAVFDRVTMLTTSRHRRSVSRRVPKWWGIILCRSNDESEIAFETYRDTAPNPTRDSLAIAQLLWRSEARKLLSDLGIRTSSSRGTRAHLHSQLSEAMKLDDLSMAVRSCLKTRKDWRRLRKDFSVKVADDFF